MANDTIESEIEVTRYADPYFFSKSLADGPVPSLLLVGATLVSQNGWLSARFSSQPMHGNFCKADFAVTFNFIDRGSPVDRGGT